MLASSPYQLPALPPSPSGGQSDEQQQPAGTPSSQGSVARFNAIAKLKRAASQREMRARPQQFPETVPDAPASDQPQQPLQLPKPSTLLIQTNPFLTTDIAHTPDASLGPLGSNLANVSHQQPSIDPIFSQLSASSHTAMVFTPAQPPTPASATAFAYGLLSSQSNDSSDTLPGRSLSPLALSREREREREKGFIRSPLPSLEQLRARILLERQTAGLQRSASTSAASQAARAYALEKLLGNTSTDRFFDHTRQGTLIERDAATPSPTSVFKSDKGFDVADSEDEGMESDTPIHQRSPLKDRALLRRSRTIGGLSAMAEAQRKAAFVEGVFLAVPGARSNRLSRARQQLLEKSDSSSHLTSNANPHDSAETLLTSPGQNEVNRSLSQRQIARTEMIRKLSTRGRATNANKQTTPSPGPLLTVSAIPQDTLSHQPLLEGHDPQSGSMTLVTARASPAFDQANSIIGLVVRPPSSPVPPPPPSLFGVGQFQDASVVGSVSLQEQGGDSLSPSTSDSYTRLSPSTSDSFTRIQGLFSTSNSPQPSVSSYYANSTATHATGATATHLLERNRESAMAILTGEDSFALEQPLSPDSPALSPETSHPTTLCKHQEKDKGGQDKSASLGPTPPNDHALLLAKTSSQGNEADSDSQSTSNDKRKKRRAGLIGFGFNGNSHQYAVPLDDGSPQTDDQAPSGPTSTFTVCQSSDIIKDGIASQTEADSESSQLTLVKFEPARFREGEASDAEESSDDSDRQDGSSRQDDDAADLYGLYNSGDENDDDGDGDGRFSRHDLDSHVVQTVERLVIRGHQSTLVVHPVVRGPASETGHVGTVSDGQPSPIEIGRGSSPSCNQPVSDGPVKPLPTIQTEDLTPTSLPSTPPTRSSFQRFAAVPYDPSPGTDSDAGDSRRSRWMSISPSGVSVPLRFSNFVASPSYSSDRTPPEPFIRPTFGKIHGDWPMSVGSTTTLPLGRESLDNVMSSDPRGRSSDDAAIPPFHHRRSPLFEEPEAAEESSLGPCDQRADGLGRAFEEKPAESETNSVIEMPVSGSMRNLLPNETLHEDGHSQQKSVANEDNETEEDYLLKADEMTKQLGQLTKANRLKRAGEEASRHADLDFVKASNEGHFNQSGSPGSSFAAIRQASTSKAQQGGSDRTAHLVSPEQGHQVAGPTANLDQVPERDAAFKMKHSKQASLDRILSALTSGGQIARSEAGYREVQRAAPPPPTLNPAIVSSPDRYPLRTSSQLLANRKLAPFPGLLKSDAVTTAFSPSTTNPGLGSVPETPHRSHEEKPSSGKQVGLLGSLRRKASGVFPGGSSLKRGQSKSSQHGRSASKDGFWLRRNNSKAERTIKIEYPHRDVLPPLQIIGKGEDSNTAMGDTSSTSGPDLQRNGSVLSVKVTSPRIQPDLQDGTADVEASTVTPPEASASLAPTTAAMIHRYSRILTACDTPALVPGVTARAMQNPPRHLMRTDPVFQVISSTTIKDRYLFLFNDILVVVKPIAPPGDQSDTPIAKMKDIAALPTVNWKFAVKNILELHRLDLTVNASSKSLMTKSRSQNAILWAFVDHFNRNPDDAVRTLIAKAKLPETPLSVAQLLYQTPQLDRSRLTDYLTAPQRRELLRAYVNQHRFTGVSIESSLRSLLLDLRFPPDLDAFETMLIFFAQSWTVANADTIKPNFTSELASDLVFAIMALNDALHTSASDQGSSPISPTSASSMWPKTDVITPGFFSAPCPDLKKDDFIQVFRQHDPDEVLADRTLGRIFLSIRSEPLSQALTANEPKLAVRIKGGKLPTRLTYAQPSEPITLCIAAPDPDLAIRLYAHDSTFEPPILTFSNSNEASFTVTSRSLGTKQIVFVRAGRNARFYTGTELEEEEESRLQQQQQQQQEQQQQTPEVKDLPLPRSVNVTVERAFMKHSFTLTSTNHNGSKKKFMFSFEDADRMAAWVHGIVKQSEKCLDASKRGVGMNTSPSLPNSIHPQAKKAAEAIALQVLRETLISPEDIRSPDANTNLALPPVPSLNRSATITGTLVSSVRDMRSPANGSGSIQPPVVHHLDRQASTSRHYYASSGAGRHERELLIPPSTNLPVSNRAQDLQPHSASSRPLHGGGHTKAAVSLSFTSSVSPLGNLFTVGEEGDAITNNQASTLVSNPASHHLSTSTSKQTTGDQIITICRQNSLLPLVLGHLQAHPSEHS